MKESSIFYDPRKIEQVLEILETKPGNRTPPNIEQLSIFLSSTNLFKKIKDGYKIKNLCQYMELEIYDVDDVIFKQGEIGLSFYLILTGSVDGFVSKITENKKK